MTLTTSYKFAAAALKVIEDERRENGGKTRKRPPKKRAEIQAKKKLSDLRQLSKNE